MNWYKKNIFSEQNKNKCSFYKLSDGLGWDITPIEKSHPLPTPPPTSRWIVDRGAIPDEPFAYLDGDSETGKAALIEHRNDEGLILYESVTSDGVRIGVFQTIEEAAKTTEKYIDNIKKLSFSANKFSNPQLDLLFEHIHEDFHNEQHDYVLVAKESNTLNPVGMIEYSLYEDEIYINNILVKKDLRRQGIGTKMIEDLNQKYSNNRIHWGMLTDDGDSFYRSLQ